MRRIGTVFFTLGMMAFAAHAQVESGPKVGAKLEALKVAIVAGEDAGNELDLAAKRGDKPTVYVFVQADKFDRPIGRFLKVLDQELPKARENATVVAVWLTDDADKSKEYLPRVQQSIKLEKTTWTVFTGPQTGPTGWAVNGEAYVTVITVDGGKVKASHGFRSLNDSEVPKIVESLKAAAK